MGLDIYVGPLCRYYSRDWQTVVQKWGETAGVPVSVVRPDQGGLAGLWNKVVSAVTPKRSRVDPVVAIRNWRESLAESRSSGTAADWDWPESLDIEYETDKPDFDLRRSSVVGRLRLQARPQSTRGIQFGLV